MPPLIKQYWQLLFAFVLKSTLRIVVFYRSLVVFQAYKFATVDVNSGPLSHELKALLDLYESYT